jgi:hypothetical protein
MHRVINAILALLHLDLGRTADADHRNAARELGETLLQLLTVVEMFVTEPGRPCSN